MKIVRGVLGGGLVLALFWCTLAYLAIPAWRVFLGWSSFWGTMAFLTLGLQVAAAINLPTGLRIRGLAYRLNVLGGLGPIAVAVYAHGRVAPSFSWMHLFPVLASAVTYGLGARVDERGVTLPSSWIFFLSIADVNYFHGALGLPLREVMWWSWVSQFSAALFLDLFLAITKVQGKTDAPYASIGGAGARDGLWLGPVSGLICAFVAQWLFWGGHDPSVFVR